VASQESSPARVVPEGSPGDEPGPHARVGLSRRPRLSETRDPTVPDRRLRDTDDAHVAVTASPTDRSGRFGAGVLTGGTRFVAAGEAVHDGAELAATEVLGVEGAPAT
jgi:hypothetical protein